jgi:hypothetical protein
MSTIGSLIVEVAGDNSKLKRSLRDSAQLTDAYKNQLRSAQATFAASAIRTREDLFRGVLSPAQFAQQGKIAAGAYNNSILSTIDQLRSGGQLTPKLHARLVTEMRETGLEAGQALTAGMEVGTEGTSAVANKLSRRFQSTGVSIAFAMEAMANGTEAGSKRALRSIALLAFAFGPEVGGITLAITTATQFMIDFFDKARAQAEKTMFEFRGHLAEMARAGPGGFIQAAKAQQTIQSGDPFAAIEGQRKDETKPQFDARRLGIVGLERELVTLRDHLNDTAKGWKEYDSQVTRTMMEHAQPAVAAVAKMIGRYSDLRAELTQLHEQEIALAPVLKLTTQAESDAAQGALDAAARARQKKDDKVDQTKVLEEQLNQVVQTRDAMEKLGLSLATVADVTRAPLVHIFDTANDRLAAHLVLLNKLHKGYDQTALHLEEIAAKAGDALVGMLKLTALPPIQLTTTGQGQAASDIMRTKPLTKDQVESRAIGQLAALLTGSGTTIGGPTAAALPTTGPGAAGPGVGQARIDFAQAKFADTLRSVGSTIKSWAGSLASMLNPVQLIGKIFQQFAQSFAPVVEPLAGVFADLAAVVAKDVAPIFKALEPVLRALIPIVDNIMQVLTPVLVALAPMFAALIPIIKSLLPIIKLGAILSTYLFQAFALGASIFLKAVGNIIAAWGFILKKLAEAIDALPFVSAQHAIDVAQGIIDFGNALVESGGDFKKAADAMAKARDDINAVTFDDTAGAVGKLGEAAVETADALKNVPTWWRSALAVFQATNVRADPRTVSPPITAPTPTPTGPVLTLPPIGTSTTTGAGGAGAIASTPSFSLTIGKVEIPEQKDGRALLKTLVAEAQRISQATFGTTSRWAEVL